MARTRRTATAPIPPADFWDDEPEESYEASPVSRQRRTRAEIEQLREAIVEVVVSDAPVTVRQVFYRLSCSGHVEKSETGYDAVQRQLVHLRHAGAVQWSDIADNTRWMRKPRSYDSMQDALERTAASYRRAFWRDVDAYVEIWLEKDALAGVVYEETEQWDVPLMVCRGYSSLTFLHSAAEAIAEVGKPTYLYYLGDLDPSGANISEKVERTLRHFAPEAEIYFERIAVTREQVERLGLPTRPTKKSDSRAKNFKGRSVEVDAIEPRLLREMVRNAIEQHVPEDALSRMQLVEHEERETLQQFARTFRPKGTGT